MEIWLQNPESESNKMSWNAFGFWFVQLLQGPIHLLPMQNFPKN